MKIEFLDEDILAMAEAINRLRDLDGLRGGTAGSVLPIRFGDTEIRYEDRGYYKCRDIPAIQAAVERYRQESEAAADKALNAIRAELRRIADGGEVITS